MEQEEGEEGMVEAFVLIQVEMAQGRRVTEEVGGVSGVQLSQFVTGPYDVVARVQAPDVDALGKVVDEIQRVPGVTRTLTCTVIRL